jgi:hypothetical protein
MCTVIVSVVKSITAMVQTECCDWIKFRKLSWKVEVVDRYTEMHFKAYEPHWCLIPAVSLPSVSLRCFKVQII